MGDAAQEKARKEVRQAQADFEHQIAKARDTRRRTFERAQKAGLSLRAIGEEAGLHHTRVGQVIRGE